MVGLVPVSAVSSFAVTITVDPSAANSVLFRDYRSAPPNTTFNNAVFVTADGGGTTVYGSNGNGSDPQITHGGGNLDLTEYPNLRARYAMTTPSGDVFAWRNPATGGQNVNFGVGSGTMTEFQSTIPNPAAGVSGFRIDPVQGGTGWTIEMDYLYVDRGRTIGFEFDHDGDETGLVFNGAYASRSVAGGSLSGQSNPGGGAASDVTISFNPFFSLIDPDIYKFVEIRMAGFAGDRIDFFYSNTSNPLSSIAFDPSSDGTTHTYLLDFTGDAAWSGTLDFLRLDPAVSSDATFSIESIRFYETAIIPEPGAGLLVGLSACALLFRRRRA